MHQTNPDGTLIASYCDFCRGRWDPAGSDLMIEGHKGSLICLKCLSTAFRSIVLGGEGVEHKGKSCTLCIEERAQVEWESPAYPEARICLRCVKQAATALEKDPESGWKRPGGGGK